MGLLDELRITTEIVNGKTVLTLHGKVTIRAGVENLGTAIADLLDQGGCNIVIDLQDVTAIDSAAIGELAAAHMSVTTRGGTLELSNPPAKIRDVLAITNFPDFPDSPDGFAF